MHIHIYAHACAHMHIRVRIRTLAPGQIQPVPNFRMRLRICLIPSAGLDDLAASTSTSCSTAFRPGNDTGIRRRRQLFDARNFLECLGTRVILEVVGDVIGRDIFGQVALGQGKHFGGPLPV